jgi:hypothetical protein
LASSAGRFLLVKARGFTIKCLHYGKRPRDSRIAPFSLRRGSAKEVKMFVARIAQTK